MKMFSKQLDNSLEFGVERNLGVLNGYLLPNARELHDITTRDTGEKKRPRIEMWGIPTCRDLWEGWH